MRDQLISYLTQIPGVSQVWRRFPVGSIDVRVRHGIFDRPPYAFGVHAAAILARQLGLSAIQTIEFGVAGGRGLLALERIADAVQHYLNVQVSVCGFDTGRGMPAPIDYRDLPYVWAEGFYSMDAGKLKAALKPSTRLVLGDIKTSLGRWEPEAPVGFVAFDLDYYSSTKEALNLFNRGNDSLLPRVYSYFDDVMWPPHALHNEWVGELCAIREFNETHQDRKLCPIHMFRYTRPRAASWNEQMYVLHDFNHPLYCSNITNPDIRYRQKPL